MKVISLTEPFATLIKEKKKKIETRSWKTSYRGEIYIHASSTRVPKEWKENKELMSLIEDELSFGKIICKCNLVDCIEMTEEWIDKIKKEQPEEYVCGIYEKGRYAWVLEKIEPLEEPITVKGHLGIWNYEEKF